MYTYPLICTPVEHGQYMIEFPDVPQALTYGETKEQALAMAQDALHEALDQYMDMKQAIPKPRQAEGQEVVSVSPMVGIKLCIYQSMLEQGMTQEKLAKLMMCDAKQVRRILDIFHNSTLDQLTTALYVLGYTLELNTKPIQELSFA